MVKVNTDNTHRLTVSIDMWTPPPASPPRSGLTPQMRRASHKPRNCAVPHVFPLCPRRFWAQRPHRATVTCAVCGTTQCDCAVRSCATTDHERTTTRKSPEWIEGLTIQAFRTTAASTTTLVRSPRPQPTRYGYPELGYINDLPGEHPVALVKTTSATGKLLCRPLRMAHRDFRPPLRTASTCRPCASESEGRAVLYSPGGPACLITSSSLPCKQA
jgi:hypothetical protein